MPPHAQPLCGSVLLVASQKELCQEFELVLIRLGHSVESCTNLVDALTFSARRQFDLIVVDASLSQLNQADFIDQMKSRGRNEEIVVVSFAYVEVEGQVANIVNSLEEHLQTDEPSRKVQPPLPTNLSNPTPDDEDGSEDPAGNGKGYRRPAVISRLPNAPALIGRSHPMKQLFRTIERVAPIDGNVLITGATGTGKELVARAIHDHSARRNGPFVDVNSSAIPDTLFEAEFFGHQRGTFTGAYETRRGLFERASGGTLFLDEVDTLNLTAQAKLLRVLQERHLRRLGGRENISVDVRIIAATSTNLKPLIVNGTFRPDLFFRLRVVPLHVPQLRERADDIPLLVDYFLRSYAKRTGTTMRRFSSEAISELTAYSWPGNVRELENAIEYALAVGGNEELGLDDLPPDTFGETMEDDPDLNVLSTITTTSLAEVERRHILSVFDRCGRHHIRTAAALRIDRRTLYRKLQQYNMELEVNSA